MRLLAPLCPARTSGLENWKGPWIASSPPSLYKLTLRPREGESARKVTQRIRDGAGVRGPGSARGSLLLSARASSPPRPARSPARSPAPRPCSHPPGRCTAQGGSPRRAPPPPWWSPHCAPPRQPSPPPAGTAARRTAGLCFPRLNSRGQTAAPQRSPGWDTVRTCIRWNKSGADADSLAGSSREDPRAGFGLAAAVGAGPGLAHWSLERGGGTSQISKATGMGRRTLLPSTSAGLGDSTSGWARYRRQGKDLSGGPRDE